MTATLNWEPIAAVDELISGDRKSVFIDDIPALLIRLGDQYFAVEDLCTHDGQPLTDGPLEGQAIICPRHGAKFDLATGQPLCMPATSPIQTFLVDVRVDGIYAAVGSPDAVTAPTASTVTAVIGADSPAELSRTAVKSSAVDTATPAESPATEDDDEVSDGDIIDALRQVIDPELMVNIVDLGLVYSINHSERKAVIEMTLTSPACPAGPQIVSQAKMVTERLNGIDEAQIKLTMSPPWTPDRMTDEARDQLGFF